MIHQAAQTAIISMKYDLTISDFLVLAREPFVLSKLRK